MLAARLAQIPFSFTLHGPADLAEPVLGSWRENRRRPAFVACISITPAARPCWSAIRPIGTKLRIIHCGVDPSLYGVTGSKRTDPRLHLVFVGRLAPVKGLRVLIEALLARGDRDDVRLTIVGDGTERATLEAMAAPLGEAVHFTGYQSQDEVAAILATADAFVLPSFAEGVPVVLMEALAANLPVIATRITGVPELVEDGVSGFAGAAGGCRCAGRRHRPVGRPARPGARPWGLQAGPWWRRSSTFPSRPRDSRPCSCEGPGEGLRPAPAAPRTP
jgi:glycosyltransferase involved in cell wall biosynthesis